MYHARVSDASGEDVLAVILIEHATTTAASESRIWSRGRPEGRTCYEVPVLANWRAKTDTDAGCQDRFRVQVSEVLFSYSYLSWSDERI